MVKVSTISFPEDVGEEWALYYGPKNAVAVFLETDLPIGKELLDAIEKAITEKEEANQR